MKENNHFEELVVSYLLHELTVEEEAFVLRWINSSKENRTYFEEVKRALHLLESDRNSGQVDVEVEWRKFAETLNENATPGIPKKESQEFIAAATRPSKGVTWLKYLATTAIAACVLLAVVIVNRQKAHTNAVEVYAIKSAPVPAIVANEIHHEINNSNKTQTINLADGSQVLLHVNSEISFKKNFGASARDITLSGDAEFKVAKDKSRPFTVKSSSISTTALGTRFTVYAAAGAEKTRVKLYEGKVVIRSAVKEKQVLKKDYYLLPGQEFIYDNRHISAVVKNFRAIERSLALKPTGETNSAEHPTLPSLGKSSWFMFNNQQMGSVFKQLEQMYGVSITYPKSALSNTYLVGTFSNADPIDTILMQIARLHSLKLSKENNKYIISK